MFKIPEITAVNFRDSVFPGIPENSHNFPVANSWWPDGASAFWAENAFGESNLRTHSRK